MTGKVQVRLDATASQLFDQTPIQFLAWTGNISIVTLPVKSIDAASLKFASEGISIRALCYNLATIFL
jgi:hypothetical protein